VPPENILVVEDEPLIAENIIYALETEGYATISCGTGSEALKFLGAGPVDLVILDLGLPDVSGFELLREIRRAYETPVIIVTARTDEVDRVVGLEVGADDYIVKPFSPREMTARVRAVLRRTSGAGETTLKPAASPESPFQIDEGRRRITYSGEVVTLSRYEYALLSVLIAEPGRVFSRGQLMDRAWDEPDMSLDRTVDAHIKSLRKKLRIIRPDIDPIETHRGVGYSLLEEL